jgi:hypothetical protein
MQRMKRSHAIIAGFAGASILAFWAATAGADTMPPAQSRSGMIARSGMLATSNPATPKPAIRIIPLHKVANAQETRGRDDGMNRVAGG